VLFHPLPRPAELERAWQVIQRWGGGQYKRGAMLYVPHQSGEREARAAEAALAQLARDEETWQVIGYASCPFEMWFGEAHNWLQVWFEKESTTLIVHDDHCATGVRAWDLRNVLAYRELIRAVAGSLSSPRFLWGFEIDAGLERDAREIGQLDSIESLWEIYSSWGIDKLTRDLFREEARPS
jgi:hypothetical protein